MQRLLAAALKELRVLRRDWQGLLVLFLLPAVFILTMSLALQGSFQERLGETVTVPVVDEDNTPASRLLLETLAEAGAIEPRAAQMDARRLIAAVADNTLSYGLIIRPGFADWVQSGGADADESVVEIYTEPAVTAFRRTALEMAAARAMQTLRVERVIAATPGFGMPASASGEAGAALPVIVRTPSGSSDDRLPNAVQQNVPAWLVFAMFFVVIPISTVFIVERQQGSVQRLRLMNVPASVVFGGKVLPYYLVNMAQMIVMLIVGALLVPLVGGDRLDVSGSWLGLWLIGSGTSIAAIGYALLISVVAGTSVQATTFAGVTNLVMGAVGGVMVPKAVMSASVQQLTVVSPMSWGLEGFWDILLRKQGWTSVLPEAGALGALGLICLFLGTWIYKRRR